jgi:hypothetical protein
VMMLQYYYYDSRHCESWDGRQAGSGCGCVLGDVLLLAALVMASRRGMHIV